MVNAHVYCTENSKIFMLLSTFVCIYTIPASIFYATCFIIIFLVLKVSFLLVEMCQKYNPMFGVWEKRFWENIKYCYNFVVKIVNNLFHLLLQYNIFRCINRGLYKKKVSRSLYIGAACTPMRLMWKICSLQNAAYIKIICL